MTYQRNATPEPLAVGEEPAIGPRALRIFALAMVAANDELAIDIAGDRGVADSPLVARAARSRADLFSAIGEVLAVASYDEAANDPTPTADDLAAVAVSLRALPVLDTGKPT